MVETRGGRRFAIFFFVAAFVVLLVGRWVQPVDDAVLSVAAPFASAVSGMASGIGDSIGEVAQGPSLYSENQRMRKEIGQLITQNISLRDHLRDDKLLRRMVAYRDINDHLSLMPARVIGMSADPISPFIFIDKGRRDGLKQGMTVVDQNGYFVGSISDLLGNMSKVVLMTNPSSTVGATDELTRASGDVDGQYGGRTSLDYVATRDSLRVGDPVVTSGLMNMYPRGLLMGQITSVDKKNVSLFQSARMRPAADMQGLELVQIVRGFVPNENTRIVQP